VRLYLVPQCNGLCGSCGCLAPITGVWVDLAADAALLSPDRFSPPAIMVGPNHHRP